MFVLKTVCFVESLKAFCFQHRFCSFGRQFGFHLLLLRGVVG